MKLRILSNLYAEFEGFESSVIDEDLVTREGDVKEDAEGVRRMEGGFPDRDDQPMDEGYVFYHTPLPWWMA